MSINRESILNLVGELLRYGLVSAAALAVDFCCLFIFSNFFHYLWAATLSFILGGLVAYLLSVKFVFDQRSVSRASSEAIAFIALGLVGLAINAAMMKTAVGYWAWSLAPSKLMAAGATFSCNFVLRKWLLFTNTKNTIKAALYQ